MIGGSRPRICSLLPSATEIVAALGEFDLLVGRSPECDFPPSVTGLPVVTRARIDSAELDSAAIDAAVRAAFADVRSLYAVDAEQIAGLAPDLILTQDLCQVCAVSSRDDGLRAIGVETLALDAHSIAEIEQSVLELGGRLGAQRRAQTVVEEMEAKIQATMAQVEGLARCRVFVSEWLDPPIAAGHWLPEMVAAAGGVDVLGQPRRPSFPTSWDVVRQVEPELVVLALADSTLSARLSKHPAVCCLSSAARSSPSTPTPTTRARRRGSLTASANSRLLHLDEVDDPGIPYRELRGSLHRHRLPARTRWR